jgi:hypothetical protein
MYSISLNFEYSRIHFPSLSSGCEIAQFFVRHTGKLDAPALIRVGNVVANRPGVMRLSDLVGIVWHIL